MLAAAPRPTGDVGDAARATVLAGHGTGSLVLSKHEAAGNDFLVLVDPKAGRALSARQVRAICDRRQGVGADGLILAGPPCEGADLTMTLYNADGSPAEMSGNGIRCLVQAAISAGIVAHGACTVATSAGNRRVELWSGPGSVTLGRVDMGPVRLLGMAQSPIPGTRAWGADVGNPHLVVVGGDELELDSLDLEAVASRAVALAGRELNVEVAQLVAPRGELRMRVLERGVGETAACGTGSCAVAAVARSCGMVGDKVVVHNPGGRLEVTLGATERESVFLSGPVRHIADVVVDGDVLSSV